MATRRQLIFLAGGLAAWMGGFRFLPELASRLNGFEFRSLETVPGFRTISASPGARSTGGGGFDVLAGLAPVDPLPPSLMQEVRVAPEKALFDDAAIGGNAVRVAYFFDYYCPYCRVLSRHLADLVAEAEISVTRQHWPIFGEASELGARASLAAAMQGDVEGLHDRLLRSPGRVTPRFLQQVAGEIGLSWSRMAQDMQAPSVTASLNQTRALAQLFSFIGTPSLVIGRTVVEGEISKSRLRDLARLKRGEA